jgi:hypothetical protein
VDHFTWIIPDTVILRENNCKSQTLLLRSAAHITYPLAGVILGRFMVTSGGVLSSRHDAKICFCTIDAKYFGELEGLTSQMETT